MYKILRMLLHAPMRIRATGVNKQESLVTPVSCKTSRGYRSVNSLSCYVVMLGLPSYVIYICKARILSGSLCEWAGNWYRCSTNRTNFTTRFSFFFSTVLFPSGLSVSGILGEFLCSPAEGINKCERHVMLSRARTPTAKYWRFAKMRSVETGYEDYMCSS